MAAVAIRRGMSPTDYQRGSGNVVPLRSADRPAPSNVTDGRFWGDELFGELFLPDTASTEAHAARISAVNLCVSLIAEAVGSQPIEFTENGNKVEEFDLAEALAYGPNPMQTAAEFWPSMLFQAALAGHAFAEPLVTGEEIQLWALEPERTHVDWRSRGFTLTYTDENNRQRMFNAGQLFWFTGLSNACLRPLTPWKMAKSEIDFALALMNQGRKFFQNGTRLGGVLETDQKLDQEGIETVRAGVDRWRTGKIAVLEQGLKYKDAGTNNSDSQYVELVQQLFHQLARYWRIPRAFYADEGGNAKSQEQEAQTFVKWVARPWTRRVEQAIRQRLLTPDQRRRFAVKFNMDGILRGDSATQWKNAVLARTAGILSVNTIRTKWFNEPAIADEWADDPRAPLNSNRAGDTLTGGETSPQDKVE